MTLAEFASELPDCKTVYIAIMPNSERWEYDLEVEINHGTIGGVYATDVKSNARGLRNVRKLADELDAILTARGIRVFKTRDEWDMWEGEQIIAEGLKPIGTAASNKPV